MPNDSKCIHCGETKDGLLHRAEPDGTFAYPCHPYAPESASSGETTQKLEKIREGVYSSGTKPKRIDDERLSEIVSHLSAPVQTRETPGMFTPHKDGIWIDDPEEAASPAKAAEPQPRCANEQAEVLHLSLPLRLMADMRLALKKGDVAEITRLYYEMWPEEGHREVGESEAKVKRVEVAGELSQQSGDQTASAPHNGTRDADHNLSSVATYSPTHPAAPSATEPLGEQIDIDIRNLRFYSQMAKENDWDTDIIHYGVIEQTLKEIADRLAALRSHRQAGQKPSREAVRKAVFAAACKLEGGTPSTRPLTAEGTRVLADVAFDAMNAIEEGTENG